MTLYLQLHPLAKQNKIKCELAEIKKKDNCICLAVRHSKLDIQMFRRGFFNNYFALCQIYTIAILKVIKTAFNGRMVF